MVSFGKEKSPETASLSPSWVVGGAREKEENRKRSWKCVIAFCLINEIRVTLINEDEAIRKPAEKLAFHLANRMKILGWA